jgi:hypothetical protein
MLQIPEVHTHGVHWGETTSSTSVTKVLKYFLPSTVKDIFKKPTYYIYFFFFHPNQDTELYFVETKTTFLHDYFNSFQ